MRMSSAHICLSSFPWEVQMDQWVQWGLTVCLQSWMVWTVWRFHYLHTIQVQLLARKDPWNYRTEESVGHALQILEFVSCNCRWWSGRYETFSTQWPRHPTRRHATCQWTLRHARLQPITVPGPPRTQRSSHHRPTGPTTFWATRPTVTCGWPQCKCIRHLTSQDDNSNFEGGGVGWQQFLISIWSGKTNSFCFASPLDLLNSWQVGEAHFEIKPFEIFSPKWETFHFWFSFIFVDVYVKVQCDIKVVSCHSEHFVGELKIAKHNVVIKRTVNNL